VGDTIIVYKHKGIKETSKIGGLNLPLMAKTALSHFNSNVLAELDLPSKVILYDSTLRDGEQTPGVSFSREQKIQIANMLERIGIPQIEAGFPAVSDTERSTVKEIANLGLDAEILALSRACRTDIDAAIESEADMVMLFTATSNLHLEYKYHMTGEEQLAKVTDAFDYARDNGIKFSFSTEDSTRTDYDYLVEIFKLARERGACRLGIADTTGCIMPSALGVLVKHLTDEFDLPFSVHLHNDFGLGLANALISIENGANAVATTINGIGERAGNVPTEQLAIALELLYDVKTGITISGLKEVCKQVSQLSGIPIAPNQPWFGKNAFRHESGIHVAAILSNSHTYECVPPEILGLEREFVLGKHSGHVAVKNKLAAMGIELKKDELDRVVSMVKERAQAGNKMDIDALQNIVGIVLGRQPDVGESGD